MRRRGFPIFALVALLVAGVSWWLRHQAHERPPLPQAGTYERIDAASLRVQDGDTLRYGGTQIRLLGTDAPERRSPHFAGDQEPHGTRAKEYLAGLIARAKEVRIVRIGDLDQHDRVLAYLYADGVNVSAAMVRAGHAYETVSFFGHQGLPKEAGEVVEAARGVKPAFERPAEWRRRAKAVGASR